MFHRNCESAQGRSHVTRAAKIPEEQKQIRGARLLCSNLCVGSCINIPFCVKNLTFVGIIYVLCIFSYIFSQRVKFFDVISNQ